MMPRVAEHGHGSNVAVIRATAGPGELLCMVPALRALRGARPDARVTVVGLKSGRWLKERRSDLIDDWMDLPAWPGVHDATGDPSQTLALLASALPAFDTVIQLHGPGGPVNRLAQVLSAGTTVVHVDNRLARRSRSVRSTEVRESAARELSDRDRPKRNSSWPRLVERAWPTEGHEVHRLLGLTTSIGLRAQGTGMELPELPEDVGTAGAVWRRLGRRPFIVVHPTSTRAPQAWDPDGFGAVVRSLAIDGWAVVVTGSGSSRETVARVALQADVRVVPALDLPLNGLAAVLRRASALITSDINVGLIAQSTGCPVNLVASSVDFGRWGLLESRCGVERKPTTDTRGDVAAVLADTQRIVRRSPGLARVDARAHRPAGRLASPR